MFYLIKLLLQVFLHYENIWKNFWFVFKLGHADAVWGLSYHGPKQQLLSCSADGTVKLWKPSNRTQPLLKTFGSNDDGKVPTSVDWIYSDPSHMVAAYSNAACIIYDIESGKPLIKLDTVLTYFKMLLIIFKWSFD